MPKKILIHYHSDCPFFAGCENMLTNFFNSDEFRKYYDISFSYRYSASYMKGFKQRVHRELPMYPVSFLDLSGIPLMLNVLPSLSKRIIMALIRLLLTGSVLTYEIVVLYRLFRKISPDILHVNNGGYPAALSARAAAIAGKLAGIPKVLMVVNNMAVDYQRVSRWIEYPVDCMVARSVDQFITGSEAAAVKLRSVLSIPDNKVKAIHNGISLRSATAPVAATRKRLGLENFEGVIFGVVALLVPRKGHFVLLEAVVNLVGGKRENFQQFKLLIEGGGPLRQELGNFVKAHNLSRWVMFVGNEKNVVDFMSAIDVLILPSVQDEDFPNVILEAMALGKPVIASRLAGTPEQIIDGVTGLLVDARNNIQLGEAIAYMIDNQSVMNKMGRASIERFNSFFTSDKALSNYTNMYSLLFNSQSQGLNHRL